MSENSRATPTPDYRAKLDAALDTIARLRSALQRRTSEPIAIIGVGHRFPGAADTPEGLWRLLRGGVDAIGAFPADRWDTRPYFDPDPDAPGKTYVLDGGYLDDVHGFDAQLFGISPAEATGMDPQQRIALEVAWETFERAGVPVLSLNGSRTGVYVGVSTNDYVRLRQQFGTSDSVDGYQIFGESSFVAGRISHTFGLHGPSQVIDTACSSSLVAVHQACRSLRSGEVDMALAGGVNTILSPYGFVLVGKARAAAPDGRCKTFDAAADGYARAEGCGMVLLKRLSDALADGDDVLAVVRGSAVNHDGRASGISVPNPMAQRAVLRAALADAGVEPGEIDYVEAHGTGTALGDPIELGALDEVLGAGRDAADPLLVGSVKTNFGHLEAAAGVAGLMKVVQILGHREVPPHLHLRNPNPNVDWDALRVRVPVEPTALPDRARPARAGLSSFGASGTNAHLVVEEFRSAEPAAASPAAEELDPPYLLALSGRAEPAVRRLAGRFAEAVSAAGSGEVPALCRAATQLRSHHGYRMAVVAQDPRELAETLRAVDAGENPPGVAHGRAVQPHRAKVAFLFPGQGAQYAGMGRDLYAREPVFRQAVDRCAELMEDALPRPLLDVVFDEGPAGDLDRTGYTQPALFAVEYALAQLWRSWGVEPCAVLGHSIGEYVAATVAGAIELPDATRLVAARAGLMQAIDAPGGMIAVAMSEQDAAAAIGDRTDQVSVAAVNGPEDVVLAGAAAAIEELFGELTDHGLRPTRLRVSHAFHSPLIEPALTELERVAAGITVHEPRIPVISNVTGDLVGREQLADPTYWSRHARGTVRFADGIRAVLAQRPVAFLEVGPGRTLQAMGSRCVEADVAWLSSMRRSADELTQVFDTLGRVHVLGVPVDHGKVHAGAPARRVPLPTYPFQRQRFTFPTASVALPGADRADAPGAAATGEPGLDYHVEWRERPVPEPLEDLAGDVVVFADGGRFGAELVRRLSASGLRCRTVRPGPAFEQVDVDAFRLPPGDPEAVARLIEQVGDVAHVLYLWPLDRPGAEDAEKCGADLPGDVHADFFTVLELLRGLDRRQGRPVPAVRVVGRGEPGGNTDPVPGVAAAALAGLGQVAALEHPAAWGGVLDLDPAGSPEEGVTQLLAELRARDDDDQVVLRGNRRLVPRLVAAAPPARAAAVPVHAQGTYLVTGGLGGLGLTIARWLVERGARTIVLTSRRGLPDRATWDDSGHDDATRGRIDAVRDLEATGATVAVHAADTADETAMAAVLAQLPEPLRGVVHAAGTAGAQLITDTDPATAGAVLRPKVDGTWLLHRLLGDTPLDFFVCMSSVAAVWGSGDLAAYAAANAFLDRLAAHRRSRGLAAVSVNWGPWEVDSGLGGPELLDYLTSTGLRPMPAEAALDRLGAALSGGPQVVVADVDWTVLAGLLQSRSRRPLLGDVEAGGPAAAADTAPSAILVAALEADPAQRDALLDDYARRSIAGQLGVDRAELTDDASLVELGMDSLAVMQVMRRFREDLQLTLAPRPFFAEPAVRWGHLLAGEVAQQHDAAA
ncbi:type I polyketide synthase [Pseudonocardia sp. MH-G8]|uniref:beta-ketoacyl synthase N-terminal-like domain-containing protein n=1 Tax=Pseudonocardia sp. MH-G8 TaxID=1854588 RepID=UPI000BA040B0|nr:type I polyketide synthase [Pseudonocardia sp. MH-G8]OZM83067.1 short-chain dehydrogenase [Pseudonocardia sp. MH-G8]